MIKQKIPLLFMPSSWGAFSWPLPRNSLPAPPGGKKDIWVLAVVTGSGSKGTGIVSAGPFCSESLLVGGTDVTPPVGWEQGRKFSGEHHGEITAGRRNLGRKQSEPGAGSCSQSFLGVEFFLI